MINCGVLKLLSVYLNKSQFESGASNTADRRSEELYNVKDFYRQKGARTRKLYWAKRQVGYCKVTCREWRGSICRLTNADQAIAK